MTMNADAVSLSDPDAIAANEDAIEAASAVLDATEDDLCDTFTEACCACFAFHP